MSITATKSKKKVNGRNKGANGEREFATIIADHLGIKMIRNLEQCRGGGYDLVIAPGQEGEVTAYLDSFGIEIKRYATLSRGKIEKWWDQAQRQAYAVDKKPLLAFRADRDEWRVMYPVSTVVAVEMALDTFILIARECISIEASA